MEPDYQNTEHSRVDLSWVEKPDLSDKQEPSVQQLIKEAEWKTERWIADLLRDESYVPSPNLVKATLALSVMSARSGRMYSNEKYNEEPNEEVEFSQLGIAISETDPHQQELLETYDESLSKYLKSSVYHDDAILLMEESHPLFPQGLYHRDDANSFLRLSRTLTDRLSGTPGGAEVAEWMIDNITYFDAASDHEEMTSYLYAMTSAAGRPNRENSAYFHKLSQMLASKKTIEGDTPFDDLIEYTTPTGDLLKMEFAGEWNITHVMYGFGEASRNDTVDGLIFTIAGMPEGNERNKLLAMIYGQKGPAYLLNNMRQIINDENLLPEDRRNASKLFRTFYEGVATIAEDQQIPPDIKHFYTLVADNEAFMTEQKEGEKHHQIIKEALKAADIGRDDLVIESACGKGWLTDKLQTDGFHVIGSDLNPDLLDRAKQRFPNSEFYLASWDDLSSVPNAETAKAFIINGRSVHHLKQFDGFHAMMSEMKGAEIIIFDAANPETGAQKERLDTFRHSLENFDYNKEWLDHYMWQGVGSHDGVILGDRWYPPEDWWKNMMGMHGFEMQIIREPNYDGRGTENMVMISRPVKDEQKRKELMKRSDDFFKNLYITQPDNPNGSGMYDWQNLKYR